MARSAELIHRIVFVSVNNPRTPMPDTASIVQEEHARVTGHVSGMAIAGSERWLCMLEGRVQAVEQLHAGIIHRTRPKALHLLMTDDRAKQLLFPTEKIGWRFNAPLLEMASFVNDLHRGSRKASLWSMSLFDITSLLDPGS